ncbi:PREDICTED: uncharacterized protein LOC105570391 [Vollenhovia emeryi]|uniref:uncharacterized protein LOC105570391 n=1 Tax=Vollenhovia emeryi TaxID=411798 RepID=UPI0005F3B065|nr:PREDICTED: uncharacterized protein LOC105570391 [Vollenhovia emeryi]
MSRASPCAVLFFLNMRSRQVREETAIAPLPVLHLGDDPARGSSERRSRHGHFSTTIILIGARRIRESSEIRPWQLSDFSGAWIMQKPWEGDVLATENGTRLSPPPMRTKRNFLNAATDISGR